MFLVSIKSGYIVISDVFILKIIGQIQPWPLKTVYLKGGLPWD